MLQKLVTEPRFDIPARGVRPPSRPAPSPGQTLKQEHKNQFMMSYTKTSKKPGRSLVFTLTTIGSLITSMWSFMQMVRSKNWTQKQEKRVSFHSKLLRHTKSQSHQCSSKTLHLKRLSPTWFEMHLRLQMAKLWSSMPQDMFTPRNCQMVNPRGWHQALISNMSLLSLPMENQ